MSFRKSLDNEVAEALNEQIKIEASAAFPYFSLASWANVRGLTGMASWFLGEAHGELPASIDALETELAALHAAMAGPDYYRQPGDVLAGDRARLADLEARLAASFARWETLEATGG